MSHAAPPPFQFDPSSFPTTPGVYLMYNRQDEVIYVGKAANLRTRLRSYFSRQGDGRPQIRFLVQRLVRIETIVTDTEKEALILENALIKRHRPRYNIDLRDDKTYVSLRLDLSDPFPALEIVRRVKPDGASYFGPYSSAGAVRQTMRQIYRLFPLRHYPVETCRKRGRPCLFHQIGQCCAPCYGLTSPQDYRILVNGVVALLSGRENVAIELLRERMRQAAQQLRFEEAALLRDQVRAIEATVEKQKVVSGTGIDQDVVGVHREGGEVQIAVLSIRNGTLIGQRHVPAEWQLEERALLSAFLQEYYARDVIIPDEILLPWPCEDADVIGEWLRDRRGKRVALQVPQRGDKTALVQLATRNAREAFRSRGSRRESRLRLLEELRERLHLGRLPRRIECFDISNTQGGASVGSMAVLVDGEPAGRDYRHYRIRSITGADDYASLGEVLRRRLTRGMAEAALPDMILIDGGKGQLAVVAALLAELRLGDRIDAVGIAKSRVVRNVRGKAVERSEERFFLPGRKNPVTLRAGSPTLFLLERLRDEAHRFAITHHRKLRGKAALASPLDAIPGIGPQRRKQLLKHFGSLKRLRAASQAEIETVPGFSAKLAAEVHRQLAPGPTPVPDRQPD